MQRLEPGDDDSKRKRKFEGPNPKTSDSENSSSACNSDFRDKPQRETRVVKLDTIEKCSKDTAVKPSRSDHDYYYCRITTNDKMPLKIKETKTDGKLDEIKPKVMFSGFSLSELREVQKMCSELGLEVTSQARSATHLVMPCLNQTISFLCAISFVKFVVDVSWIKDSHKELKLRGKN
jgi:hypothetical protein